MKLRAAAVLLALSTAAAAAPAGRLLPLPDAAGFTRACEAALAAARGDLAAMQKERGAGSILREWNRLDIRLDEMGNAADLFSGAHPDKAMREAAEKCQQQVASFWTDAYQSGPLSARIASVKPARPADAKLRKDLLEAFEDAGAALPAQKRAQAKALLDRIEELRATFERNAREDPTRVAFTPAEMEGLPEAYLEARKRDESGNYVLGLDAPSFTPFMAGARDEAARERYFRARFRQGGEANLEVLHQLFLARKELAALYGLPSYADYALRRKMAARPAEVKRFLDEVKGSLDALERRYYAELRAAKAADRGTAPQDTRLHQWDVAYYRERLRRERYDVDQEKLRAYFPSRASLDFAFLLASRLYGLRFVEQQVPVWHPDVRYFEAFEAASGRYRGGIYVDIFPREGKRAGAAAYPLNSPSRLEKRPAMAALVANFDRAGFNQRELETLLHEMGHVLHVTLADVDYVRQAINGVKWDFVEAPSQMFEEWARREQTLALFREVCAGCPVLTAAEIARLEEARRFGMAGQVGFQWLLASYDMELSLDPRPPLEIWRRMESATPAGHVEGTMFPAAFRHIAGSYAAGYYGYMWSRVMARDMLSRFGDDLMDPKVAARYREALLARGSSAEEAAMVRDFLGRAPSSAAFFHEITGKPH